MEFDVRTVEQVTVIKMTGEIDGKTAPGAGEQISAQIHPGVRVLLDMAGVTYMSSAGLRVLLATYRQILGAKGRIVLVGLSKEIADTMAMTGFLRYFTVCETVEEGLAALG